MEAETVSGEDWADEADAPPQWGEILMGRVPSGAKDSPGLAIPWGQHLMEASGANVVLAEAGFFGCCDASRSADNTDCLTAHNA